MQLQQLQQLSNNAPTTLIAISYFSDKDRAFIIERMTKELGELKQNNPETYALIHQGLNTVDTEGGNVILNALFNVGNLAAILNYIALLPLVLDHEAIGVIEEQLKMATENVNNREHTRDDKDEWERGIRAAAELALIDQIQTLVNRRKRENLRLLSNSLDNDDFSDGSFDLHSPWSFDTPKQSFSPSFNSNRQACGSFSPQAFEKSVNTAQLSVKVNSL